jgi:DNA-binding MarR family transcriptional regulator
MKIRAKTILNSEYNIDYSQFLAMHTINTLGSPTQHDIAIYLELTGAGVSKITEALLEKSLILKKVNIKNKRANTITLTIKGKKAINSALDSLEKEFDMNINKNDKKIMSDITDKTIINLLKTYENK